MPRPGELAGPTDSSHASESEQDTSDDHFSDASEGAQLRRDRHAKSRVSSTGYDLEDGEMSSTHTFEERLSITHPDETGTIPRDVGVGDHEDVTSHPENAGDEFDEFEEGDDDNDFGAFDEGTTEIDHHAADKHSQSVFSSSLPMLTYDDCNTREAVVQACSSYIDNLFPNLGPTEVQQPPSDINASLLNERSQSLWAQLVAPPPLQPPNWVRSRIRRLFLVSLGVPVDLDEILPASKQKKLILPSTELGTARTDPLAGSTPLQSGDISRLKTNDGSSVSINSQGAKSEKRRRGAATAPDFDLNAARLICTRTDTALQNLTDMELKDYIGQLEQLKHRASELLQYWLVRRDSATGDKEAFEEVIENLVKHAKKIRK